MSDLATRELWSVLDARRVKAPELTAYDTFFNSYVGWAKNRVPAMRRLLRLPDNLRAQAQRVDKLTDEIHALGATRFREEVAKVREEAQIGRASCREEVWRERGEG